MIAVSVKDIDFSIQGKQTVCPFLCRLLTPQLAAVRWKSTDDFYRDLGTLPANAIQLFNATSNAARTMIEIEFHYRQFDECFRSVDKRLGPSLHDRVYAHVGAPSVRRRTMRVEKERRPVVCRRRGSWQIGVFVLLVQFLAVASRNVIFIKACRIALYSAA